MQISQYSVWTDLFCASIYIPICDSNADSRVLTETIFGEQDFMRSVIWMICIGKTKSPRVAQRLTGVAYFSDTKASNSRDCCSICVNVVTAKFFPTFPKRV